MQLTLSVFRKLGWVPRSVGTPGRQWSGYDYNKYFDTF